MGCLASQKKKEDKLTPQDYRVLWKKCLKIDGVTISPQKRRQHPVFEQIAKDINRTFPNHAYFLEPDNKKRFQNVLKSYALQFPKMGYTQGLNFVAGFLLITGLNEQQTLKTLIAMTIHPQLMLIGLYQDNFPLCRLYCQLFWLIILKVSPETHRILKAANLPDQLWIFQWFITLFLYSLPLSYIQDLLNFIVVKRYFAAVRLAVGIVICLEKYLSASSLKEDGFIECFELLKSEQFCLKYLPVQRIIKKSQKISNQMILKCLHECKEGNWYRKYFGLGTPYWQKQYSKRMCELKMQRQQFIQENETQLEMRYTRIASSMNIIDSIQQILVKKYQQALYRSSVDKNMVFYSRMSMPRYHSMAFTNLKNPF